MDLIVGVAAAVISFAGLVLGVVRYRAGRPRLKVTVSLAMLDPGSGPEMFVVATAANLGGHPMKVVSAGLRLSDRGAIVLIRPYPWTAGFPSFIPRFGDHATYLPIQEIREHLQSRANTTRRAVRVTGGFYRDATGHEWRCKADAPLLTARPA